MAFESLDNVINTNSIVAPPINSTSMLITINVATQLPLKVTKFNYFSEKAQFTALLFSLDLLDYLTTLLHVMHQQSFKMDQLILYAILTSLREYVIPLASFATSSHEAWTHLSRLYAKRSTTHMIHLKDKLITTTRGDLFVTNFLVSIKQITNELTLLEDLLSDADLLLYATRGLGPAYKELITAMHSRDTMVHFEKLFDKIIDHETFLLHNENQTSDHVLPIANLAKHHTTPLCPLPTLLPINKYTKSIFTSKPLCLASSTAPVVCQYCDKRGYAANRCFKLFPTSTLSHHVTSHLSNLSFHQLYESPNDIHNGDDSGLPITHIGNTSCSPSYNLSIDLQTRKEST
ncbi:hypothetical protein Pfo_000605 [Paulownia fortunei]|nr:hypothetical protein Pfo_000605 [Paulownia fortunei]